MSISLHILRLLVRFILWAIPMIVLGWVADRNLAFSGRTTLVCTAEQCDPRFVNLVSSDEEIITATSKTSKDRSRVVTTDDLRFDAKFFRTFDRARVRLVYQNPASTERLTLAVLAKGSRYSYYSFGEQSEIVARLEEWETTRNGDLTLFQRPDKGVQKYTNFDEFFANLPPMEKIGTYNVDFVSRLPLSGYQPSNVATLYDVSTRGSQTFVVHVGKDEDLDVSFTVQDINRHKGKDDLTFRVLRGQEELTTVVLRDDGNALDNGVPSAEREVSVTLPRPGQGTYRIEARTETDDLFIHRIRSRQNRFVWDGKLYLAGSDEYRELGEIEDGPMTVYVRGTTLTASTSHVKSPQTITVGSQRIVLEKRAQKVSLQLPKTKSLIPVTAPIRDVLLETDGTFALHPSADFEQPKNGARLVMTADHLEQLDYVFAQYHQVQPEGQWLIAEQTVAPLPGGQTKHFIISSSPPLGSSPNPFRFKELRVTFEGKPLTPSALFSGVKRYLQRAR